MAHCVAATDVCMVTCTYVVLHAVVHSIGVLTELKETQTALYRWLRHVDGVLDPTLAPLLTTTTAN